MVVGVIVHKPPLTCMLLVIQRLTFDTLLVQMIGKIRAVKKMNDAMGVHFNSPERSRTGKKASVALPDNEDLAFTVVVTAFMVLDHSPRSTCLSRLVAFCILRSKWLLLLLLWLMLLLLLFLLILLREQAQQ
jgi:hypothetical protein